MTDRSPTRDKHSSLRRLGDQALALFLRVLARLLSLTALPVNHFYGLCTGLYLNLFSAKSKEIARTNLRIAYPDASPVEQNKLMRSSLFELGKTMSELGPIWLGSKQRVLRMVKEVRGEEICKRAVEEGRGIVILCPHFGCWELVGLYLSVHYDVVSLYRPPRMSTVGAFMRKARERFGACLVPTDGTGVRALFRALGDNKMTIILPDQDPGESGGIQAPFFGFPAPTMLLASRLASKTNCLVAYCAAERLPRGQGYRLHIVEADPEVANRDGLKATTAMNEGIESMISINPAQYQWTYRRYRNSEKDSPYRKRRAA